MDEIKTTDVRWLPSQEAVVKINVDDRCMLGTGTCPGIRAFFFFVAQVERLSWGLCEIMQIHGMLKLSKQKRCSSDYN